MKNTTSPFNTFQVIFNILLSQMITYLFTLSYPDLQKSI